MFPLMIIARRLTCSLPKNRGLHSQGQFAWIQKGLHGVPVLHIKVPRNPESCTCRRRAQNEGVEGVTVSEL